MGSSNHAKDIQGAAKLTVDAIVGITDIVEAMHRSVLSLGGRLGDPAQKRTMGIKGIVYKTVRGVTKWVGHGLDLPLNHLSRLLENSDSSFGREAVLSTLNGMLGDYLADSDNPLAISMELRQNGKSLSDTELSEMINRSNGRVNLMVHGLCMNDLQWNQKGHDHGLSLSQDLGITPIYLRYNTGLHTSENGRKFADLLEAFLAQFPQVKELNIIAHSMGGLVTRGACYYGKLSDHTWLNNLKSLVFLGTPHHGAVLEKGGNWIDNLLEVSPYSAPFARLGKIRSSGVTDLRYGNVVDEDWQRKDRFEFSKDERTPVPLPEGVLCYAIAGTTSAEAGKLGDGLIGDGLVTVDSALGHHQNPKRQLLFLDSHQWVGREMNHFDLLNDPQVYQTLKRWLTP